MLTRPDRDDAEYRELASRYTSSITLGARAGEGVLIQQAWILTTGRNARALDKRGATISIGDVVYDVDRVFPLPKEDVALIRLKAPVRNLDPVRLYKGREEEGRAIAVVGHGPGARHGQREAAARAGLNTIDAVTPTTLLLRTKSGDDASDLQGVLTAGEEGAGAFVEVEGAILLAGIYLRDGDGGNVLARVSSLADWIEATMLGAERDALKEQLER